MRKKFAWSAFSGFVAVVSLSITLVFNDSHLWEEVPRDTNGYLSIFGYGSALFGTLIAIVLVILGLREKKILKERASTRQSLDDWMEDFCPHENF